EDGIRDFHVTGVQTCALPICQGLTWQLRSIASGIRSFPEPNNDHTQGDLRANPHHKLETGVKIIKICKGWHTCRFAYRHLLTIEIGRASCRERVSVTVWGVAT